MESQEVALLRQRLERLERRTRVAIAGWVVSIAVLVLLAAAVPHAAPQYPVLRARGIEVVDERGQVRMTLNATKWPELRMYDPAGKTRILLDGSEAPGLGMSSGEDKSRIALQLVPPSLAGPVLHGASLLITDSAGNLRISIGVSRDGPALLMYNAAGKLVFSAP